ncbi:hypothetical protein NSK_002970 [Nannochloropsis salina CCMP1776]|uniref:Peptidase M20 dimerisation domain-containing protein n=1 Tax=Nannochloropsis salina CCMP1776 TaxID=1027361 RepID=A0A4D9D205_9STRA|nr:hypothetical protein NSK_002970 [Nannochloropsis salina CCMP1776]|eukprot:TFJ85460.1 hypothetical protein NSK_002970 [Nannochloropsis salina CCMP1776]
MTEASPNDVHSFLHAMEMNDERYLTLLAKLIGEAENLQNNPQQGLVPQENLAANHVLALLEPHSKEKGGPLLIERIEFTPGRSNLIVKYPGTSEATTAFVGSHMDVVPANPEGWERNPFELTREGDMLFGRGTTDCLGHVALITELLVQIAEHRPALKRSLIVVFIANEENSSVPGIGVDGLLKAGALEQIKNGPLFWVDCADSQPCLGTCGMVCWKLKVHGRLFHSGLPHKAINPIELGTVALQEILRRFYADFPTHLEESKYNYVVSSSMKPTQVECARGSLNQVPPHATFSGDIRSVPFYEIKDVKAKVESYVADLNQNITSLPSLGPFSSYVVSSEDPPIRGKLELEWIGEGENGIAVKLGTVGNIALTEATKEVLGSVTPYSITGSLPLVRYLQDNDFDVQLVGYGKSAKYHAENEAADLKDFRQALRILARVVAHLEKV